MDKKPKFKTQFDKRPVSGGVFPCDELLEGDGLDPRYDRGFTHKVANRKALQLCAQVRDSLNLVLASLSDDALRDLYVDSVIPAPDSTQLLAIVITVNDPDEVSQHIHKASGLLRSEVATSINRKRVPNLKFQVRRVEA